MRAKKNCIGLYGKSREERIGEYIIETGATVRAAAAHFGISKSTVHKDVAQKLKGTNYALYTSVKAVLEKNKAERHIRGGEATRKMYLMRKSSRNIR
ncbi:MAG: sporulation transcriptional regulator SpoIIID [Firmicutes bacterium]|nr:sporulation transcriptional regulator SpoIIID [Bacillota bacterium]MCD8056733.1 sporulation transcriptional regulator SpoIIID [Clostridiales bacterium]